MEKLLTQYSINDILIFLIVFAFAFKGIVTFFDWLTHRLRKVFNKEQKKKENKKDIENRIQRSNETIDALAKNQNALAEAIQNLSDKVDMLIESDKDDIKSFLTKEHHYFCYQNGWIDDYSLECCERRYAHYKKEGGNSFIARFMEELRKLPKQPPQ